MSNVILINPFEVPEGKEEACLAIWEAAAEYMRKQPGFISTKLHRALSSDVRFYFINIADEWESPQHFQAAIGSEEFKQLSAGSMETFPHFPGLYEVIRT